MRGIEMSRIARSSRPRERALDRLGAVGRLGDDLEVGLGVEDDPQRRGGRRRGRRRRGCGVFSGARSSGAAGHRSVTSRAAAGAAADRAARPRIEHRALAHAADAARRRAPTCAGRPRPSSSTVSSDQAVGAARARARRASRRRGGRRSSAPPARRGRSTSSSSLVERRQVGCRGAARRARPACSLSRAASAASALREPELVERFGPQPRAMRRTSSRLRADGLARLARAVRRPPATAAARLVELQQHAGQRLADLVVELARDPPALGLLGARAPGRALSRRSASRRSSISLNASASSRSSRGGARRDVRSRGPGTSGSTLRISRVSRSSGADERRMSTRFAPSVTVRPARSTSSLAGVDRGADGRRAERERERRDEHHDGVEQDDAPRERGGPDARSRQRPGRARRAGRGGHRPRMTRPPRFARKRGSVTHGQTGPRCHRPGVRSGGPHAPVQAKAGVGAPPAPVRQLVLEEAGSLCPMCGWDLHDAYQGPWRPPSGGEPARGRDAAAERAAPMVLMSRLTLRSCPPPPLPGGCGPETLFGRARLRARVWMCALELDRTLADGGRPEASAELGLRAELLIGRRSRAAARDGAPRRRRRRVVPGRPARRFAAGVGRGPRCRRAARGARPGAPAARGPGRARGRARVVARLRLRGQPAVRRPRAGERPRGRAGGPLGARGRLNGGRGRWTHTPPGRGSSSNRTAVPRATRSAAGS